MTSAAKFFIVSILLVFLIIEVRGYHANSTESINRLKRATKSCEIDIKKKMTGDSSYDLWPLLLDLNYNFKPVNLKGKILMKEGEKFIASCPGSTKINGLQTYYGTFKCADKNKIILDGKTTERSFYTLKCDKLPQSQNKFEKKFSSHPSNLYNIGFQVTPAKYVTLMKINYDNAGYSYVKHTMGTETQINEPHQKSTRPDFAQGAHPIPGLKGIYNQPTVKKHLIDVLGQKKADDWMTGFDKGHLAANADFAFSYQQKATFYYLNCIPQFHNFNAKNWIVVEKAVRKLAMEKGNIVIYTGVTGSLVIDNKSIYLDAGNKMPVPSIFWKAVIINQKATYMFVGLNYPTSQDFSQSKKKIEGFCDPCPTSVFKTLNDATKGIVMCCMYDTPARERAMRTFGIEIPPFA